MKIIDNFYIQLRVIRILQQFLHVLKVHILMTKIFALLALSVTCKLYFFLFYLKEEFFNFVIQFWFSLLTYWYIARHIKNTVLKKLLINFLKVIFIKFR